MSRSCLSAACSATISTQRTMGRPEVRMMENWEQIMARSLSLIFTLPRFRFRPLASLTSWMEVMTEQVLRSWVTASYSL